MGKKVRRRNGGGTERNLIHIEEDIKAFLQVMNYYKVHRHLDISYNYEAHHPEIIIV